MGMLAHLKLIIEVLDLKVMLPGTTQNIILPGAEEKFGRIERVCGEEQYIDLSVLRSALLDPDITQE